MLTLQSRDPCVFYRPEIIFADISKYRKNNVISQPTLWCSMDALPLIHFLKFFQPGHSYSNHLVIKFQEKFHPTQAFKIYTRFVQMKIKKTVLKNQKILLNLGEFFNPCPLPPSPTSCFFLRPSPLIRFWRFSRVPNYSNPSFYQKAKSILSRRLTCENLQLISPLDPKICNGAYFGLNILKNGPFSHDQRSHEGTF